MGIRLVVSGAGGRMGRRIVALASEDPDLSVVGAVEAAGHPALGQDAGTLAGVKPLGARMVASLSDLEDDFDAIVDFSAPAATLAISVEARKRKKAVVVGTTGFSEGEQKTLVERLRGIPAVWAPNMSVGVNVLFRIAADVARFLGDGYDVEIVEAHHRHKADAPSGTALRLAEGIARERGMDFASAARYGRQGRPGPRQSEEIGILAARAGDIVGEHTVLFAGPGERLELVHRAHTRDNFAQGALRAVKWVVRQPAGLYDMMDVLGLRT